MSRMQLAGIGFQAALGHNLGTQYVRDENVTVLEKRKFRKKKQATVNGQLKKVGVVAASLKSPFYLMSKYVYSQKCYGARVVILASSLILC